MKQVMLFLLICMAMSLAMAAEQTAEWGKATKTLETTAPASCLIEAVCELPDTAGLAKSRNEARRLIEQKGVRFEGNVIEDPMDTISGNGVLQVGKRHFLRIVQV